MRYLGLDVGAKLIGVAVGETLSAELTTLAAPKNTSFYDGPGRSVAVEELRKLIELEEADGLVVGLPVDEDGQETEESKKISKLAKYLEAELGMGVHFTDETLTSFMAEELLESQGVARAEAAKRVHQAAAALILQQYLEGGIR